MTSTNDQKAHKLIADSIYHVSGNGRICKMINLTSEQVEREKTYALRNISTISAVFLELITSFTDTWVIYKKTNPGPKKLYVNTKVIDTISGKVKKSYFILAVIIQAVAILNLPYVIAPLTNDKDEFTDGAMLVERGSNV